MSTIERFEQNTINARVVRANGFVFVGGQTPDDLTQDMAGQTAQVLKKIDHYLESVGLDKNRIVSAQVWVKHIGRDFDAMNAVWSAWVPQGQVPARATVEANLRYEDMLIEIAVIAA